MLKKFFLDAYFFFDACICFLKAYPIKKQAGVSGGAQPRLFGNKMNCTNLRYGETILFRDSNGFRGGSKPPGSRPLAEAPGTMME